VRIIMLVLIQEGEREIIHSRKRPFRIKGKEWSKLFISHSFG
jgi:hypothetical protein